MSLKTKVQGLKEVWQFDNRWWLTVTKTFFPKERLHIYRYKNIEILIDQSAGDANGAREVLTSPMYRRFLPQMNLRAPLNLLDCGANNGGFPLLFQAENLLLKKVVSIELNPKTYSRLRFNLERNLDCEVVALNAALGGENKMIKVKLGAGSASDNIFGERLSAENCKTYQLQELTFDQIYLDNFLNQIVDVCKIDVEGAEFAVFKTAAHECLKNCRYVIMEIHESATRNPQDVLAKMKKLNFKHFPPINGIDEWVHFFVNSKLE